VNCLIAKSINHMNCKIFFKFGLFLNLVLVSCNGKHEIKQKKPNILFIAVDDMLPALRCYGNTTVHSPNIDTLADRGVTFFNAYCQVAISNPSRASLMTGLRPDNIKVWTLKPHFREEKPDVITLPQYYKENGYAAREVGKIYHDPAYHKDPQSWSGPSRYNVTQNGKGHKYNLPENYLPNRSKAASAECVNVPDTAYIDGKVCEAAIEVLKEIGDSTFFLAVGFRRPHLPFTAPKKYWDLYEREDLKNELKDSERPVGSPEIAYHNSNELRGYEDINDQGEIPVEKQLELLHGYFASLSYVDAQIGKLITELKRLGHYDNTIIVLYSDHGFHLGDFGLWGKTTNFEASVRVPLIFSGPGIEKGKTSISIVELIDIYPTLIGLTHADSNPELDGLSLEPLLKSDNTWAKDFALSQIVRPYADAVNSKTPKKMGYSLRTPEYRYIEWRNVEDMSVLERELYQMEHDLRERENLASEKEYEDVMNRLSGVIDKVRK
jgi:iduronate 2-sulfatase